MGTIYNDTASIFWLLVLYTLQGVPLGMSSVFPMLLKEQGANYSDLAWFGACAWPFSLKLLWAPLVDSLKFPGFPLRKSWLVPSQLLLAVGFWILADNCQRWLDAHMIPELTLAFFAMYFLAATQDVAVDGWALTMLSPEKVGYAGACNSVGQTFGYFLAFSGFMGLQYLEICKLQDFLRFWAYAFAIATLAVAVLKGEEISRLPEERPGEVYARTWRLFKHRPVLILMGILLTMKIPFSEGLLALKFQENGAHKETLALLSMLTVPLQIFLPWMVSKVIGKSSPLKAILRVYPVRLIAGLGGPVLLYFAPPNLNNSSDMQVVIFFAVSLVYSLFQAVLSQAMFVAQMDYFSRVSDPSMGGSYMTVLNSLSNIGGTLAGQISMWSMAYSDRVGFDGYNATILIGFLYGLVWLRVGTKYIKQLDRMKSKEWRVSLKT